MISQISKLLGNGGRFSELCDGYEFRRQQIEMAEAVAESLLARRNLLVEAGTGVGKSVGYLVPAVLYASGGAPVVISTHTINLQEQLLNKDIPLLQQVMEDHPFTAVLMKGRSNYLCWQELDHAGSLIIYQNDPIFERLKAWANQTETGDVQELDFPFPDWHEVCSNPDTCRKKECPFQTEHCFYYAMQKKASKSDIIIVNHSLFFADLGIRSVDVTKAILPSYGPVIFDEAHHLEDVATKAFGVEFSDYRVPVIVSRLRKRKELAVTESEYTMLLRSAERLFDEFKSIGRQEFFFQDIYRGDRRSAIEEAAGELVRDLDSLSMQLHQQDTDGDKDLKDRIDGYRKMIAHASDDVNALFFSKDDNCFKWCEKVSGGRFVNCNLHVTPTKVAEFLNESLWNRGQSTVLTSATLSNSGTFCYISNRLGLLGCSETIVGSPFNYVDQSMIYVPSDLDIPCDSETYVEQVADRMEALINLSGGRAFLLFTSYRMLNKIFDALVDRIPYRLIKQGEMSNERLIKEFRDGENTCLMGVHSFWEGVDVKGERLSLVCIDKLPFAVPDSPVNKARCEKIEDEGGDWFREYAMPQAQIRLKQGFGRLIRTKSDRGVVAILDSRIHKKFYGREFLRYLPRCRVTADIEEISKFYERLYGEE